MDNAVVNPGLVTWLLSYGANFFDTYPWLIAVSFEGTFLSGIESLACDAFGDRQPTLIVTGAQDFAITPKSASMSEVYGCDMKLIRWDNYQDSRMVCDINAANRQSIEYLNAQICVALGMNPIYLT